VARFGKNGNAHKILEGKLEGKRSRRRPVCRWENNIKLGRTEVALDDVDWIYVAQWLWRFHVNELTKFGFQKIR
jgi:hypothetical protein